MARAPRLVLLALATVLLATAPAAAHLPEPARAVVVLLPALTETISAAAPEPALPWLALASLAAVALAGVWLLTRQRSRTRGLRLAALGP